MMGVSGIHESSPLIGSVGSMQNAVVMGGSANVQNCVAMEDPVVHDTSMLGPGGLSSMMISEEDQRILDCGLFIYSLPMPVVNDITSLVSVVLLGFEL